MKFPIFGCVGEAEVVLAFSDVVRSRCREAERQAGHTAREDETLTLMTLANCKETWKPMQVAPFAKVNRDF
jgi:hypothetical protein